MCSLRKEELLFTTLSTQMSGADRPYLPTNRSCRATLLYIWSACPEARRALCVCGGRQAYLELSSYCGSQAGDSCTHTLKHVFTYTHKARIRWFPLTETDASQLPLKFVLSKGSEMPSSPHASPSHKRLQERPNAGILSFCEQTRNTYLPLRLKSGREVDVVYYVWLS